MRGGAEGGRTEDLARELTVLHVVVKEGIFIAVLHYLLYDRCEVSARAVNGLVAAMVGRRLVELKYFICVPFHL